MHFVKLNASSPLSYISSGKFVAGGDWCHKKRKIDSFVVITGISGVIYIQQEDEQYEIKPGTFLLLLPNIEHRGYRISDAGASYYWCHFKCSGAYEVLNYRDLDRELPFLNSGKNQYDSILLPVFSEFQNMDRIYIFFKQLIHAEIFNQYTKMQVHYLLTSLAIEITEQIIRKHSLENKNVDKSRFNGMLEWIRINLQKNISVTELAEKFNYNANYLSRIFKQKTGNSLLKYISSLKVEKAKYLLTNTDDTIKEIAYQLGFDDEKHFMKLFKRYENLTPTQYRNAFFYTHLNSH